MEGALPHDNLSSIVQELAGALGSDDSSKRLATTLSKEADRLSHSQKQQQPVLLVTTVDIGGGKSDRIEVRRGDDPGDVARAFCSRHGLPPAIVAPLTGHLEDNLKKAAAAAAASAAGAAVGAGAGKEQQAAAAAGVGLGEPELKPSVDGRPSPSPSIPMGPFPTESPRMPGAYSSTSPQFTPGGPAANIKPYGSSSTAGGGVNTDGSGKQAMTYSFASGMDERAYEQLSSKLLDDSAAGARRGAKDNWVNASEVLAGSGGSGLASKRSSSGASGIGAGALGAFAFGGKPAGPTASVSPRDGTVHSRLYAGAQDRASRLEERRRAAAAENEATLTAGKATRMSWISAEMMRGRSHTGMYDNYGSMLYAEGVESLMSRLKKAEAERKAREDRELEGVTFTPAITKKAWELKQRERDSIAGGLSLSGLSMDGSAAAATGEEEKWLRLHVRGVRKSTLERLDLLREQQKAAEVAECTFKPRINRNSDALMNERAETLKVLNITHYEQLYADALRRQSKAEEAQQWYPDGVTFQPQINKDPKSRDYARRSWEKAAKALQQQRQQQQRGGSSGSSPGMGGAGGAGAGDDARGPAGTSSASLLSMSVVDRLYSEAERKEAKLEAARQLYHGSVDPATGKPLYRPETGRGPKGGHAAARRGGQGVGDYLYAAARDQQARKEARVEAERRAAAEEAARSRTTATSQRMFASLKAKRFRQIFEYLDEEGAGSLDLLAVLGRCPANADPQAPPARSPRVDDLDPEVLLDVEAAAEVWARANGMLLTPAEQAAAALINGQDATAAPTTSQDDTQQQQPSPRTAAAGDATAALLPGPCPPLSLEMFGSLMEEALALRRGPRSYLCPSPSAKQGPAHSYRPHVNAKSRALAAKLRPDHVATFELLHKVAAQTHERLEALRRDKEAAGLQGCTFQPQLNASSRHVEGRALNRASSSFYGQPGANAASSVRLSLGQAQPDHQGSSFAAAAAGIAAAAGLPPPPLAHAEEEAEERYGGGAAAAGAGDGPNDLDQQLRELRMAAAQAAGVQAELEAQRRATGSHGGGGAGYGSGGEDDLALESFAQELKDLQAVAQLCISGVQQAQQEHRAEQQQQRRASGSMGGQMPAAVAAGAPVGGLQELAAALGTWDHRADPTMATLQQQREQ